MLASPCYVLSDTHLGAAPPEVERSLLEFLRAARGRAASLLINGDLFDFWFEWGTVIPRVGFRILAELATLRESGVDVVWVAGNHDCWGGDVLTRDVGVTYHVGPWVGDLAGWHALVEHGDGLRHAEDKRYRALRTVLRHPLSVRAYRALHPNLGTRLATGSSTASRTHRARDGGAGLRNVAFERLASDRGLDVVVYGHSHVAALERGAAGVYANAGSWLDEPTFLVFTPERAELRRWRDGSTEGDRLHAVDRAPKKTLTEP